ncbi:MAG: acylphosphatase [Planctomycetota bacterium]
MIRQSVVFRGRVQGVGFRYTTARIARRHAVAGYVENQPDGTVRLVAEGQPDEVQSLIDDVLEAMRGKVQSHDAHTLDPTGEFGPPTLGALAVRR